MKWKKINSETWKKVKPYQDILFCDKRDNVIIYYLGHFIPNGEGIMLDSSNPCRWNDFTDYLVIEKP